MRRKLKEGRRYNGGSPNRKSPTEPRPKIKPAPQKLKTSKNNEQENR